MRNFFRMQGAVSVYISLLGICIAIFNPAVARGQTVNCTYGCVLTHQFDNSRDNSYSSDTVFKATNSSEWWSSLTTDTVTELNGAIYAQPLFLSELAAEPKEILYVVTEENWVYALDALNLGSTPYWSVNLDTRALRAIYRLHPSFFPEAR